VRVSRLVFPGRSITPVGIALLAYYPLAYWSLMGMESGLLALEVTAGLAAAIGYVQTHSAERLRALTALLALAFLTRPDAVLFGVPLIIYVAPESARARQLRPLCLAIALLLFVAVAHTVFRQIYYGHPLPNSYYLKLAGIPLADRVANGASFIAPFVSTHAVLLSGALVGGWIDRRRETLLLAALPVLALVYQLWIGGDPWPYWRFLTPAIPALLVLCVGMLMSVAPRRAWAYCAVVFALFLADRPFLPEMLLFARPFQVMENESNVNMAVAIDELTTPEASVGGCWSGAIPYYTGRRAVDFLGKSDAHIARLPPDLSGSVSWAGMRSVPGHNKYDLAYSIQGLRPTWVERFAWGRQDLSGWGREHYETIDYRGWMLHFRRGAPEVLWRKAWPWLH
jgi:arabinofuranosyltransferase